MTKHILQAFFFIYVACLAQAAVPDDADWYISNASGMFVEKTFKARALRSEYSVSLQLVKPENIPKELKKYWTSPWRAECRILYQNNERLRTQWVFKDLANTSFLVAAISNDGSGFIEWYDDTGVIVEEQRIATDGSGYFISYTYRDMYILKAEARIVEPKVKPKTEEKKEDAADGAAAPAASSTNAAGSAETPASGAAAEKTEPPPKKVSAGVRNPDGPIEIPAFFVAESGKEGARLWTDNYRYTRAFSLRAIEREYHDSAAAQKLIRTLFPKFDGNTEKQKEFVSPPAGAISEFLEDVLTMPAAKVTYITDNKRRIISETRMDEEGNVIGELANKWENDRIASALWKAGGEERLVEFSYDKGGDRIAEKNYRNGVLERTVTIENGKEIEHLYINEEAVLRAEWKDGKKLHEERLLHRRELPKSRFENIEEGAASGGAAEGAAVEETAAKEIELQAENNGKKDGE